MKIQFLLVLVAVVAFVALIILMNPKVSEVPDQTKLKRFSSYDEMESFLKANTEASYFLGAYQARGAGTLMETATESNVPAAAPSGGAEDYSTTNIQVAGVDEADIVKNDGKYIYAVAGDKVVIVDAYPAENAKILSEIELNGTPSEIFINNDRLIVFGYLENRYLPMVGAGVTAESKMIAPIPPIYYSPQTFVKIYDISDRENPVLKRNITVDGNYFDSRMIGDYVYVITNDPVYYSEPGPIPLPRIYSEGNVMEVPATSIYYFDFPDSSYIFTNILAINTQNDGEELTSKTYLMGYSQSMYVSPSNIYIVYNKRLSEIDFYDRIIGEVIIPSVPPEYLGRINEIRSSNISKYEKMQKVGEVFEDYIGTLNPEQAANVMRSVEERYATVQNEIAKEMEKTVIHKISIQGGSIEYKTNGEVPGYILNQFSMDEYNGNFRIATTTGQWSSQSANHVYVLDGDMKIVGKLEDLAAGERIYSVRFLGEKGYVVTFRQIDPLFVIDLSEPSSPRVLGYLKIEGVSDYLHPYDETHVIGIGRDATEQGRITGMKLSLFDVSDVSNPKEVSKFIIGERGTDSDALTDHKAFLFSKSKNLLVIPIRLSNGTDWNIWQGAYVFNVDLENGFVVEGRVTHENETMRGNEYYYDWQYQIRRSLFINNVLYTVSNSMIKMNYLSSLSEINKVELPQQPDRIYPLVV